MTTKPTRRILHTSDLHMAFLGDKGCRGLESVVNTAIKRRADLLLVAGDLFDHNRVDEDLLEFVRAQFWRLPIPIVVLPGNHDCLVPGSVFSRTEFWKACRNLHVFRETHGETLDLPYLNVSIWGSQSIPIWGISTQCRIHPEILIAVFGILPSHMAIMSIQNHPVSPAIISPSRRLQNTIGIMWRWGMCRYSVVSAMTRLPTTAARH